MRNIESYRICVYQIIKIITFSWLSDFFDISSNDFTNTYYLLFIRVFVVFMDYYLLLMLYNYHSYTLVLSILRNKITLLRENNIIYRYIIHTIITAKPHIKAGVKGSFCSWHFYNVRFTRVYSSWKWQFADWYKCVKSELNPPICGGMYRREVKGKI